jgi:exoribonuclease-2
VAGKTGTAQTGYVNTGGDDPKKAWYLSRDHAWFASDWPAKAPEIAVVVLVEHGGSGPTIAAPLAVQIVREYHRLAQARNKPDVPRVEYAFEVDWEAEGARGERGHVTIVPRARGGVLDRIVSELMIHVNATWGGMLAAAGGAGLYRVQSNGKVKLATRGGEHQGLGVSHYLWASSPLRRYADLVNQRQVLALARGEKLPYDARDPELYAILADFEATYAQYGELQDRMERYWCLRWLVQEGVTATTARVVRESLVRFERLPLTVRLADLPDLPQGARVRVQVGAIDLIDETIECRYAGRIEWAEAADERLPAP